MSSHYHIIIVGAADLDDAKIEAEFVHGYYVGEVEAVLCEDGAFWTDEADDVPLWEPRGVLDLAARIVNPGDVPRMENAFREATQRFLTDGPKAAIDWWLVGEYAKHMREMSRIGEYFDLFDGVEYRWGHWDEEGITNLVDGENGNGLEEGELRWAAVVRVWEG